MWLAPSLSTDPLYPRGRFNVLNELGQVEIITPPASCDTLNFPNRPAFTTWVRGLHTRTFILGGHTDNLVFTEHKWLLRMHITAPTAPFIVGAAVENKVGIAVSGAAGLTGTCLFAFRWLDSLHNRRSPLGGSSPAVVLASQGVTFTNVPLAPLPADQCVDSLEIWVSVDGGLFRHWATRDAGAATFSVNETSTGEAYTDELVPFPKLKFAVLANDYLFAAGNPRGPALLYRSVLEHPDEYAGISVPTRKGEPIIGLANPGGSSIYTQCPESSYYVMGFNNSDIVMRPLQPHIGGFGHHLIANFHNVAGVLTPFGWFRTDGTSLVPLGVGDWDKTWRLSVRNPDPGAGVARASFEAGWVAADYVTGVLKFQPADMGSGPVGPKIIGLDQLVNLDAAFGVPTSWVVDASGLVPEVPGPGRADLSLDFNINPPTCGAMMAPPGSKIQDFFTGNANGDVLYENQPRLIDFGSKLFGLIHTPHLMIGEAPDVSDAFQLTNLWANFQADNLDVLASIYMGNEFAWQARTHEDFTIPKGRFPIDAAAPEDGYYVPRDKYLRGPATKSSGSAVSLRLFIPQTADLPTGGPQGVNVNQRAEFALYGYGWTAIPGTEKRPAGIFYP